MRPSPAAERSNGAGSVKTLADLSGSGQGPGEPPARRRALSPATSSSRSGRTRMPLSRASRSAKATEAVKLRGTIDRVDLIDRRRRDALPDHRLQDRGDPVGQGRERGVRAPAPALRPGASSRSTSRASGRGCWTMGYWDLKEQGFKPIDLDDLARAEREALEATVAARPRRGSGREPSRSTPSAKDCTRTCDFDTVCRIRQVRTAKTRAGGRAVVNRRPRRNTDLPDRRSRPSSPASGSGTRASRSARGRAAARRPC